MTQENEKQADPCVMVIFGATGDLTKRKLLPAIYLLAADGFLTDEFAIIGLGRHELSDQEFRKKATSDLKQFVKKELDPKILNWVIDRIYYISADFADDKTLSKDLRSKIKTASKEHSVPDNYLFYMAIPPRLFASVTEKIVANGFGKEEENNWRRFIYEKPFGRDIDSAKSLNANLLGMLDENQIYRIDHYLGKETVQNILVFRFGNSIFEPIWNRTYVDHVQITVAETLGVELRGGYYDHAGALRDMIPNHIFQLITLTAMEPPVSFEANAVRNEQAKILQAIHPYDSDGVLQDTVRGQYGEGKNGKDKLSAYRSEPNVAPDSNTETFAALKINIDNWRWAGVPFYIRTGKRLAESQSQIVIQLKTAPFRLFQDTPVDKLTTNRISIHIHPNEGLAIRFGAKTPGPIVNMGAVNMEFDYDKYFLDHISTGYERLLYDCMIGDATLFQRADMVEQSWRIVSSVLDIWGAIPPRDFPNYAAGSLGPKDADRLLEKDGRSWVNTVD